MERDFQKMGANALLIKRSLRSGQVVRFAGNVVVQGDVNPGAEVIAGGNVIVMGALRGMVHAGRGGRGEVSILAFQLSPTQLRIGDHFTRPPDGGGSKGAYGPEIAFLEGDRVVIKKYVPLK